eukprot:Sro1143_g246030.2  (288) ;mRNA; r:32733-33596
MDQRTIDELIRVAALNDAPPDITLVVQQTEYDLALAIREAVRADDRIRYLTDFECVQFAISSVHNEPMESLCERVYQMQCFKDEYKLNDSSQQGRQLIEDFTLQHPGFLLAVEYLETSRNYISVRDLAAFDPCIIKTAEQWRIFLGGFFYVLQSLNPNIMSMRHGMSSMTECLGASFANYDSHVYDRLLHELLRSYPKNSRESFFLNSNSVANFLLSLWKPFLPEKVVRGFQLGHKVDGHEGESIRQLYQQPSPEASRQKLIHKANVFLHLRYYNQTIFSLDHCIRV